MLKDNRLPRGSRPLVGQPAPVVKFGDVFANWILSLLADHRPKTTPWGRLLGGGE